MIRKNLKLLIITSILMLLPVLAGLLLWNQLPEQMPTHWNAVGEVDGWSSKPFVVFGLPLILMAAQWLCMLGTCADPKKKNHSEKLLHLVLWIIPALCVFLMSFTYAWVLGYEMRIDRIMPLIMGLLFAIIGNYMPKCKQNYTIGIKIPWTVSSEENWNKTHRLAGWLWVVCGLIIMLTAFVGGYVVMFAVLAIMVFVPVIYSYTLFRRSEKE